MVGPWSRIVLTALVALLGAGAACARDSAPVLKDLTGVEELRQRFNADAGRPRIVLLLSPT